MAVAVTLELPGGTVQDLSAPDPTEARGELLAAARHFLQDHEHSFGRLAVIDGEREWELALPADPSQEPVILLEAARSRHNGRVTDTPSPSPPASDPAVDARPPGAVRAAARSVRPVRRPPGAPPQGPGRAPRGRHRRRTEPPLGRPRHQLHRHRLQQGRGRQDHQHDPARHLPRDLSAQPARVRRRLQRRRRRAPAAVADDRAAQHTLFELHRDRSRITRHSLLAALRQPSRPGSIC